MPPQGADYVPVAGIPFPEVYPFNFEMAFRMPGYFFMKYYISQSLYFAIPKRPIYVNYEILCNAFATKFVNLSEANIYLIRSTEMRRSELESFLSASN